MDLACTKGEHVFFWANIYYLWITYLGVFRNRRFCINNVCVVYCVPGLINVSVR